MVTVFLKILLFILGLSFLAQGKTLKLGSTTSLCDTGVWDYLGEIFEREHGIKLNVMCVGSGMAFELAKRGDVDLIAVHEPEGEKNLLKEGHGIQRIPFAFNYFLIVGPREDPASIKGLNPIMAMRKIYQKGEEGKCLWISRGDESGTHKREKELWKKASLDYSFITQKPWYIETGTGMAQTLFMAHQKKAYTLVDRATFLHFKNKISLIPLLQKGEELLNVYSLILINPMKHKINFKASQKFAEFIISNAIQNFFHSYGVTEFGDFMFQSCAKNQNICHARNF
jgi:tungstate transport system substrate-binding protein